MKYLFLYPLRLICLIIVNILIILIGIFALIGWQSLDSAKEFIEENWISLK